MQKRLFSRCIAALLSLTLVILLFAVSAPLGYAAESFYESARLLEIKEHIEEDADLSEYATAQGSCCDGQYAYVAVQNGTTTLLKYNLNSMECVKAKKGLSGLGHANDMTYNTKEKFLAVANNAPDYDIITIVDPESLEVKGNVKIETDIYSIAYCEKMDCYFVGISGEYKFAKLDRDFKVTEKYEGVDTGLTRQGCDCDENYLYFSQSGSKYNNIAVYTLSGGFVTNITVENSHEIENIFHAGSNYYATFHYYGNFLYRLGLSDSKNIRFSVKYAKGSGEGEMADTVVTYANETRLSKNVFEKKGYFFSGWVMRRDCDNRVLGFRPASVSPEWLSEDEANAYALIEDEAIISDTVKYGSVVMTPFFVKERYTVLYKSEGEGYMPPELIAYNDVLTLPQSTFTKKGYVFDGYKATRDIDKKIFGYPYNSDTPEWLFEQDMEQPYLFKEGDEAQRMTYDGAVTFTAVFRLAFSYSDDNSELVSYSGVDESVDIPDNNGSLHEISDRSFADNPNISSVNFPASVSSVDSHAIENCPFLEKVTFSDRLPKEISGSAVENSGTPKVYLKKDGEEFFLGWLCDDLTVSAMRAVENRLFPVRIIIEKDQDGIR